MLHSRRNVNFCTMRLKWRQMLKTLKWYSVYLQLWPNFNPWYTLYHDHMKNEIQCKSGICTSLTWPLWFGYRLELFFYFHKYLKKHYSLQEESKMTQKLSYCFVQSKSMTNSVVTKTDFRKKSRFFHSYFFCQKTGLARFKSLWRHQ